MKDTPDSDMSPSERRAATEKWQAERRAELFTGTIPGSKRKGKRRAVKKKTVPVRSVNPVIGAVEDVRWQAEEETQRVREEARRAGLPTWEDDYRTRLRMRRLRAEWWAQRSR